MFRFKIHFKSFNLDTKIIIKYLAVKFVLSTFSSLLVTCWLCGVRDFNALHFQPNVIFYIAISFIFNVLHALRIGVVMCCPFLNSINHYISSGIEIISSISIAPRLSIIGTKMGEIAFVVL